ncbi:hypothetical protein AB0J43_04035 [Nonomuraea fuscirosea]
MQLRESYRVRAVIGVCDHLDVVLRFQVGPQGGTDQRPRVGDQDPDQVRSILLFLLSACNLKPI